MPSLIPYEPEAGSTDKYVYLTEVIRTRAESGQSMAEQRIKLRAAPRRSFTFRYLLNGPEYANLKGLIREGRSTGSYSIPAWPDATLVAGSLTGAETVLTLDTRYVEWTDQVLLWESRDNYVLCDVIDIGESSGDITLDAPVGVAMTRAFAVPVHTARALRGWGAGRVQSDNTWIETEFQVVAPSEPGFGWAADLTWKDLPVMANRPYNFGSVEESFARVASYVDNGFGPIEIEDIREPLDFGQNIGLYSQSREQLGELRGWLGYMRGKLAPFWLPSFNEGDLIVSEAPSGTTLPVTIAGPLTEYPGRDIFFETTSGGPAAREIVSVLGTSGTTAYLELNSTVPAGVDVGSHVSYMSLCRSDTDVLEVSHGVAGRCTLTVNVMGVL